jgi:hypothetical protein
MSRKMMSGLAAGMTVAALSLFACQSALAQTGGGLNITTARQQCNQKAQHCESLAGAALDRCLLANGHIQHACNFVRDWETVHGGCGPKCDSATRKTDNTATINSALDADEPAPK